MTGKIRGTPNYLRTVNLIAPVVSKTGGVFNFNPQYPNAGVQTIHLNPNFAHIGRILKKGLLLLPL